MFVASFDNRRVLPGYFYKFLEHTIRFCDLHFITSIKASNSFPSFKHVDSGFNFNVLNTSRLPQYGFTQILLEKVFTNLSTNSYQFEKACFERWLALNAATSHLEDDEYVCLLDTDFLIGMSPSVLLDYCTKAFKNKKIDFIAEWEVGADIVSIRPEISILKKSYLFGFCRFMITTYFSQDMRDELRGQFFDRIGNGLPGGICDMRALAAFAKINSENLVNIRELKDLSLVGNINTFVRESQDKLEWSLNLNSIPGTIKICNNVKPLVGVHFQGRSKCLIALVEKLGNVLSLKDCISYKLYSRPRGKLQLAQKIWPKLKVSLRILFRIEGISL